MVNVTFFGSKLSSSSGSPPVPALQFPFIHFLLDLPLTPLMAAFGDPATPKGDAKEKRRGDWKKERKKGFPESLHFCTLKVFALAFCISGNELKPVLGKFGGRQLKQIECLSLLAQIRGEKDKRQEINRRNTWSAALWARKSENSSF